MPDNPFQDELNRRQNPFKDELQRRQTPSVGSSRDEFINFFRDAPTTDELSSSAPSVPRFAARQLAENALAIPRATGNLIADASALLSTSAETIPRAIAGEDIAFMERLAGARISERDSFPASALINAPIPDTFDVQAGAGTAFDVVTGQSDNVSETFFKRRNNALASEILAREDAPLAAGLGDFFGDAATLALGRKPVAAAKRNRRFTQRLAEMKKPTPQRAPLSESLPFTEAAKRTIDNITNTKISKAFRQAGLRVAETGVEGAVLAALNDDDPLTHGGLAAGAQAIGAGVLSASEGLLGKGGRNLAIAAMGTTAVIQAFKSATPGGQDRILESTESAFNKLAAVMALGAVSGIAGLGKQQAGELADLWPTFADSLTSMPRGFALSLIRETFQDENDRLDLVANALSEDPNFFGSTARRRLERAWTLARKKEDASIINDEIEKLFNTDRAFRRNLNAARTADGES